MPVPALRRLALLAALAVAGGCAITRPHVKSLRDQDARSTQFDPPIPTTIRALNEIPSHCGLASDHRIREEEFRVYEVVGRISRINREPDHDFHIVLQDLDDPRARLVTESDDPDYRGNTASPYRSELGEARRMLEKVYDENGSF